MQLTIHTFVDRSNLSSLAEVERVTHAPRPLIRRLLDEEVVSPVGGTGEEPLFHADAVRVIERCVRLHEDLGVNLAGIAIIERLLQRLDQRERNANGEDRVIDVGF